MTDSVFLSLLASLLGIASLLFTYVYRVTGNIIKRIEKLEMEIFKRLEKFESNYDEMLYKDHVHRSEFTDLVTRLDRARERLIAVETRFHDYRVREEEENGHSLPVIKR